MSDDRKERRRLARETLPATHGPGVFPEFALVNGYGVASWSPGPVGSRAEAVLLHMDIGAPYLIGLRLKSRGAVSELVAVLERHADDVFGPADAGGRMH